MVNPRHARIPGAAVKCQRDGVGNQNENIRFFFIGAENMKDVSESHVIDLQQLVEENINSYEAKLESVTRYMEETATLVDRISEEQDQLVLKLRDLLARSQCLRKKDFDHMFCPVEEKRRAGFEKATTAIDEFRTGEYLLLARWRDLVSGEEELKLSDFHSVKEELLACHDMHEADVIKAVRDFHLQQEELLTGLRGLAAMGEGVRIADYRRMLRDLDSRVLERESEMGDLLEEIREAAHVIRDDWEVVLSVGGLGA